MTVESPIEIFHFHGSRSPAIVVAYLMRTYNVELEQCLTHVIKARPCVLPNDGFLKQLILYDRFLVDQRRQRQEADLMKIVDNVSPNEILVPYKSSVRSQPAQTTVPIVLTAPKTQTTKSSNAINKSSVDSPSSAQTSTSSVQSSSTYSINTNLIQVPSEVSHLKKV